VPGKTVLSVSGALTLGPQNNHVKRKMPVGILTIGFITAASIDYAGPGKNGMSETTRQKSIEKLKSFTKKIGYPDKWKEYEGVTIARNDFVGNIGSTNIWDYNDMVARMGQPVNKQR
jgi:hypothetical protein